MSADNARYARLATSDDIPAIWEIDSSATSKFGSIPALADLAEPAQSDQKFQEYLENGRVYVVEEAGQRMGYLAVFSADDAVFIEEIAVHAEHQRKGIGEKLLDGVIRDAEHVARSGGRKVARVSLTTYADVPWNGPWYKKHGFSEVQAETIGPWHVKKVTSDEEQDLNRPGYRRICMLLEKALA